LVGRRAWLPRLSGRDDRSSLCLIRRHQRKPEKYGVSGCPQVLGILTTDQIANRTPNGKSSSRRTYPILGPRGRKFRDVCHSGADSRPATLSASNRGSSGNDQASISTSQAISGAFGRGAVSGCRRQPRHVRVRRQAGCSVSFRRRMGGGQGHLRSHRAGPLLAARGHLAKSRGGLPAVARHANCLLPNPWRPSGPRAARWRAR